MEYTIEELKKIIFCLEQTIKSVSESPSGKHQEVRRAQILKFAVEKLIEEQDNVLVLPVVTYLDIPADRVIKGLLKNPVRDIVAAGYDDKGDYFFVSNIADGGSILWILEHTKLALLQVSQGISQTGEGEAG